MPKSIALIILPLFLFACTQQKDLTTTKTNSNQKSEQSVYVNEKYFYQFHYPSNAYVRDNNMSTDPTKSSTITVYHPDEKNIFEVQALTPNESLQSYSQKIWTTKKNDQNPNLKIEVGDLEEVQINGESTYQFELTKYFSNYYEGEPQKSEELYAFIENGEFVYEINLQRESQMARNILDSYRLLSKENLVLQRQANINYCQAKSSIDKDDCILGYAKKEIFHDSQTTGELCESITSNTPQSSQCYWMFAMKNKDQDLCQFVATTGDKYFSKTNCENELNYDTDGVNWRLFLGVPPFKQGSIVYFGKAEVEGWLTDKNDGTLTFFELSPESQKSLPPYLQNFQTVRLSYSTSNAQHLELSEELVDRLSKYNQNNPAKIVIDRISIPGDENVTTENMKLPEFHLDPDYSNS